MSYSIVQSLLMSTYRAEYLDEYLPYPGVDVILRQQSRPQSDSAACALTHLLNDYLESKRHVVRRSRDDVVCLTQSMNSWEILMHQA